MKKLKTIVLAVLISLSGAGFLHAQDVKDVDVKTLPQQDIKKAQKALQDAGMSVDQAAALARQRGATEQQIQDFQQRLGEGQTTDGQVSGDPVLEATEQVQEQKDVEKSTRTAGFDIRGKIFGAYLFNSKNLTFEPTLNIQTPKNYEIGIGDQILIQIWGNSQNSYQLKVNNNGQIIIPDVGPVYIAGQTFNDAAQKIKSRLTEIYSDMAGSNPGTFAQVNMGQLRSIQVNLLGEVTTPGTYTLPVTASLFNALYLSGGPNNIGSFRNIKIIRDGAIFRNIDIYKFLVDADPSDNIILKDNDIIFIPPADKRVEVDGQFKRTGIFELKENEMLDELIRFTGGFTENAYLAKIQIQRKTQQGQQILDIPFSQIKSTPMVNGDQLTTGVILESFENRVTISGAVYRPGEYEWTPGMTLLQLVLKADSLTADVFKNRGIITRFNPDLTTTTLPFDVDKVASGEVNIVLQQEDIVSIKSHFGIGETPYLSISGEVMNPGQLPWSENTTIADAVFMAGGFTEAADSTFIEVSRRLSHNEASRLSDTLVHIFNLKHTRDLKVEGDIPFYLEPYDRISIKRAPGFREQGSVTITGEVVYSGVYALQTKNQRISDLVGLAQGITPQAFVEGAQLRRNTKELGTENVAINLKKILEDPHGPNDLFLRDGDILFVPEFAQTVKVSGAIQNPFSITFEEGKSLKYYIDKTGGFGREALKRKTYVRYANGYTASTKAFIFKNYPEVGPGSEIIVPQKPERERLGLQGWLGVSSAFTSIAVAIVALLR
ncbi:MAG: SLBB domain-containing protein [Draconibacterium sp.]